MLESRAVTGRHGNGGVQIEAVEVRLQRTGGGSGSLRGCPADPPDPPASARTGGKPAEHGGALNLCVRRAVEEPLVRAVRLLVRMREVDAVARHQPDDPPPHRREQASHLAWAGRGRRREAACTVRPLGEHTLRHQGVEVHVGVQRRAEALDGGDRTTRAAGHAAQTGASPLETEHGADEHRHHAAAQAMVPSQRVPQTVRQGEHPLAYRQSTE